MFLLIKMDRRRVGVLGELLRDLREAPQPPPRADGEAQLGNGSGNLWSRDRELGFRQRGRTWRLGHSSLLSEAPASRHRLPMFPGPSRTSVTRRCRMSLLSNSRSGARCSYLRWCVLKLSRYFWRTRTSGLWWGSRVRCLKTTGFLIREDKIG